VYPNPAAGIVNVEFLYSEADEISVDVFNVYGALLSQFEFVKTNNQVVKRLDFTKFAKGVYLFRIKSATYTKEIKMIFL
jgi:hypothetical protein